MSATSTISLSQDLIADIDEAAREMGLSREETLRLFIDRYDQSKRRWQQIQVWGVESAKVFGLQTEDDVEEFMDSLTDDPSQ